MKMNIHEPILVVSSMRFSLEVAAALLLFVVAIVSVTLLSRSTNNTSLHRTARFAVATGYLVVFLTRDAFRLLFLFVSTQARNVVSDILAFPSYLKRRLQSQKRDGDDSGEAGGVDVCWLLLDGFHSLGPPHSVSQNNENYASLFDFSGPPSQLQVQDLRRPPNRFLPLNYPQNHATAWKQFQVEVSYPWLWVNSKILGLLLFGFVAVIRVLFRFSISLLLGGGGGGSSTTTNDEPFSLLPSSLWKFFVGQGIACLFGSALYNYWFHAFCRCTSRVCAHWNPYFQELGYSVEFCVDRTKATVGWSDFLFPFPVVTEQKCYLRFRRRAAAPVGTEYA